MRRRVGTGPIPIEAGVGRDGSVGVELGYHRAIWGDGVGQAFQEAGIEGFYVGESAGRDGNRVGVSWHNVLSGSASR